MKRVLINLSALLFVVPAAVAEWKMIPLEELLKQTDVIVVARLTNVVETTKEKIDYGSGTLVVSEVLRGSVKQGQKLNLEWSNFTGLACPRVENAQHTNQTLIWLLQTSTNGAVSADYPGRVLDLERRKELEALLSAPAGAKEQAAQTPKSTPSPGMNALAIHLQEGFSAGDEVVVTVDGTEIYKGRPKTISTLGLAESVSATVASTVPVVTVAIPSKAIRWSRPIDLKDGSSIGFSLSKDGQVSIRQAAEFVYE